MTKNEIKLIPVPKKILGRDEQIEINTNIFCEVAEWNPILSVAKDAFLKIFEINLSDSRGGINIIRDVSLAKDEYRLLVTSEVTIYANDYEGVCYGVATVIQLMQKKENKLYMPQLDICDKPDKDHRGFMVDLARWWHPKRTILAYLDLCFYYKLKYIHLHFVDYQSYTLPSREFPNLPTQNRHYSFEDIKEIRNHAKALGITIIPEIEMPGHATPLNEKYPEIFMDNLSDEYLKEIGGVPAIICAGNEKTFDSLKKLIDEVIEMFPDSPYIHLGGDEAFIDIWEHCKECQNYIKTHNLKSTKELYSEFTARITKYVLSKGRKPIVWEGFPREASHLISKDVIVMSWECYYNQPEDLLDDGFKIINCAWKPLYICPGTTDWTYRDVLRWNVYNMQNFSQKSRATLNPVNLPESKNILGAQLCAWEACYEYEINFVTENMAAFSERIWSHNRICSDQEFDSKLAIIKNKALQYIQER